MTFWGKLGLGVAFTVGAGVLGYCATKNIKEGSAGLVDWATEVATKGFALPQPPVNNIPLAAPQPSVIENLADGTSRMFDEVQGGVVETIFHPDGTSFGS